ncbi:unnamed protein product [Chrysoparadoxa australica]
MVLMYPVTIPMAWCLDKLLGEEIGTIHSRVELMELLSLHVRHGALDVETGREVVGALNYKGLSVKEVLTPVEDCFMVSSEQRLGFQLISDIFKAGFSRIPVYGKDRNDILGLLLAKDLIFIDPEDETPVKNFVEIFGRGLQVVWPDQTLGEVLGIFKQGKSHMAIVRTVNNEGVVSGAGLLVLALLHLLTCSFNAVFQGDPFYEVAGIITLEDIIEEILGDEIVDETDAFIDMNGQLPTERVCFDMSRLKLLNASAQEESLSSDEARAITAHLCANVAQFKTLTTDQVTDIVMASPVIDMKRSAKDGVAEPAMEDVLYRRGKASTTCTLVLTGKLKVAAAKDGFMSDAGPWSVLGADALVDEEGAFKPDFTAYISSEHVRMLRISKDAFMVGSGMKDEVYFSPSPRRGRRRSSRSPGGGSNSSAGGSKATTSGTNGGGATGEI